MKFKEKLLNFWYYYKWHTLIAVFFISVITIAVAQMITREDYDVKILYAGPALISDTQSAEICSAFEQMMPEDFNGDGKKTAALNHLLIMNEEQLRDAYNKGLSPYTLNNQKINENRETLTSNVYAGEFLIYLLAEEYYKPLKAVGAFVPLDNFGISCGTRYDEYALYLNSIDASKFFTSLASLPDDTLICLLKVRVSEDGQSDREISQTQHMQVFKNLTEFKLPEGFGEE